MNSLLQGISGTVVYMDNILVTRRSTGEHLHNLDAVLGRLANAGLRLKLEKCAFMVKEVNYLGHRIHASDLHPNRKKVQAIKEAEMRLCLRLLNY